MSVLWLPLRAYTFLIRSGGPQASASPLAESALLLALALLHHAPASELGQANPFRQAFAGMQVSALEAELWPLKLPTRARAVILQAHTRASLGFSRSTSALCT